MGWLKCRASCFEQRLKCRTSEFTPFSGQESWFSPQDGTSQKVSKTGSGWAVEKDGTTRDENKIKQNKKKAQKDPGSPASTHPRCWLLFQPPPPPPSPLPFQLMTMQQAVLFKALKSWPSSLSCDNSHPTEGFLHLTFLMTGFILFLQS